LRDKTIVDDYGREIRPFFVDFSILARKTRPLRFHSLGQLADRVLGFHQHYAALLTGRSPAPTCIASPPASHTTAACTGRLNELA
jgi:hypothetical protein